MGIAKIKGISTTKSFARSCKELKKKGVKEDGLYYLSTANGVLYQTFCDMTTAGGGWTLVASVHENNIYGKCTIGDRWSSQHGNSAYMPEGDRSWSNRVIFGTVEAATSDDYKNPGYYDLKAQDVSVWHVHNDAEVEHWKMASILRYHTQTNFLHLYGGNLYYLFKQHPVKYLAGDCNKDRGPSVPIVYDLGNEETTTNLYGPYSKAQIVPGFVTFRVFNNEKSAMAMCSGVKPTGCDTEAYCIGGGGYFAESSYQCGDFTAFAWNGYGTHAQWSVARELIESAVLIFYR
ncbi:intelectin-like [Megalops cyprinoides]|uniref:intelectin-like n=1 Tax=Megalops cyprinoides TaxID=118141 RepID=UPI0018648E07|nr:intelectin-like [Megalops cyprinoides]